MFEEIFVDKVNDSYEESIAKAKKAFVEADAVVVGAGSGLSTAAGYTYAGERFDKYFSDFKKEFGIRDMYSGGFYLFPDRETQWAWWARHIWLNRYVPIPNNTYEILHDLVKGKDYFVLTTNVDHCFQRAGFDRLLHAGRLWTLPEFSAFWRVGGENIRQRSHRAEDDSRGRL